MLVFWGSQTVKKQFGFVPPDPPADTLIRTLVCGGSLAPASRASPPGPRAPTRLLSLPACVFDPLLTRMKQIECGGLSFVAIHPISNMGRGAVDREFIHASTHIWTFFETQPYFPTILSIELTRRTYCSKYVQGTFCQIRKCVNRHRILPKWRPV